MNMNIRKLRLIPVVLTVAAALALAGCSDNKEPGTGGAGGALSGSGGSGTPQSENQAQPQSSNGGASQKDQKDQANSTGQADPSNSADQGNASAQNGQKETAPSYYGRWVVDKVAGYTPITTGEEELLNKKASYAKDEASFDDQTWDQPVYQSVKITKDDFLDGYRVELTDLGIDADEIESVDIDGADIGPGGSFFVKDKDTLLILWDGVFFS